MHARSDCSLLGVSIQVVGGWGGWAGWARPSLPRYLGSQMLYSREERHWILCTQARRGIQGRRMQDGRMVVYAP